MSGETNRVTFEVIVEVRAGYLSQRQTDRLGDLIQDALDSADLSEFGGVAYPAQAYVVEQNIESFKETA